MSLLCVPSKSSRDLSTLVSTNHWPIAPTGASGLSTWEVNHMLLTEDTEDSFSAKKKAGAVFINVTAGYNIVWHGILTCKLLRLLPGGHMVHMIMEMVGNRSFTLTTRNGKKSRLGRFKNGVQHWSLLAPLLFNIYIYDLPNTVSGNYVHVDDLTIMRSDGDWQAVEGVLSKNMATVGEYFQTCKPKLSTTKAVSAVFHLNNKEVKCEMKLNLNNKILFICPELKYLKVTLDRSLTYSWHLESLHRSWYYVSRSWGSLLAPAGVLEQ